MTQTTSSLSQLSDGIGVSSSLEESSKRSSSLPAINISPRGNFVDHASLEQERIDRSNGVRERLGPLIERLKTSMKNIQTLENSMRISKDGDGDGDCDCEINKEDKQTQIRSALLPGQSRKLMNQSMKMVKKKMFRLKIMEEELASLEDRRVNLHQYSHQEVSLQATEARSELLKDNLEYQNRILELEEEIRLLKEKSATVDDLRLQNARLFEKTKHVERLERELEVEKSLRDELESNLYEHQREINNQVFKAQENSNLNLEQNIMETMAFQGRCLSSSIRPPQTIERPATNESITLTEPMTLSWTESSISNYTNTFEIDDSNSAEESHVLLEDATSQFTVQTLRAEVEALNRENAGLRESKSHTLNKYKSLHEKMIRHSSTIDDLRRKLDCGVL